MHGSLLSCFNPLWFAFKRIRYCSIVQVTSYRSCHERKKNKGEDTLLKSEYYFAETKKNKFIFFLLVVSTSVFCLKGSCKLVGYVRLSYTVFLAPLSSGTI